MPFCDGKPLSETALRALRPENDMGDLVAAENFSLLPSTTSVEKLEAAAIQIFSLPSSTSVVSALDFVATEIGVRIKDLRAQEVVLAVHYIAVYGGGVNHTLGKMVLDNSILEKSKS